jgi:DNA modification methylase
MIIDYYKLDLLEPYKNNPRNNKEAVDKVASSIKEFGFKNPIIIDQDNVIIAGHTRYLAAKKLGFSEVPVIKVKDLSPEQVKAFRIADNKTSEFAEWDFGTLSDEFRLLEDMGYDLGLTAFNDDEINEIMDNVEITSDEVVEDDFDIDNNIPENPTVVKGQIWQLGRHRLMCGDSTSISDLMLLMGGKRADMVFTDPPYNVAYVGKTKDALVIENDSMSDGNFYQFLYDVYEAMFEVTIEGGPIYVCHADSEGVNFRSALKDTGWELKQCLIWVKNVFVMGRQDHHWKHEPILYGWKPGAAHKWYGGRNKSTILQSGNVIAVNKVHDGFELTFDTGEQNIKLKVPSYELLSEIDDSMTTTWYFDKPMRNAEHPTMKPIGIPARAIKNSSRFGDNVLDTFGGSGSTLMAAEQTNRNAFLMELDPKYVDVIIKRWEEYTGEKAVLISE